MSYSWTLLKEAITEETSDVFEAAGTVPVSEAVEIFRKIIDFPVNGIAAKLAGLPDLWQALEGILLQNEANEPNFTALAVHFEAYLKKILYLTDETYYTANANYLTLGDKFDKNRVMVSQGLISKLQLNPGNYQYWLSTPITATKNYANHLWRAYNTRNDESHTAPPRNRKQYWECVQSYLVMYLWAAHKHKQAILAKVEPHFLSAYLQNYISNFRQWQRLFVALDGVERPELLVDNFAVEVPHSEQSQQGEAANQDPNQPDSSRRRREAPTYKRSGSVMELRQKIAEKENQMVIIAEPGMGKSTALQYLAYIDAIAIEQGNTDTPYPVYLELKEFQAKDNIKERIVRQWGISPDITERYLQKGNITLLLDGLNETSENLRHEAVNAIRRFMIDYPKVLVILTCRPNAYEHKYFDQIPGRAAKQTPVFQLQPMGMAQIEEFLTNYCATDTVHQIILNALHENEHLRRVVQTPLLLKMLIDIVSRQPQAPLPPTEPSIVLNFIEGIYQREAERDAGFSPKLLQKLLPVLAHQTRMQHQANITLPAAAICQMLQNEAPKWEIEATLYKAEELHLLVRNPLNNHYSFTHELYQETLWAYQQTQYDQYPPTAPMLYQPAIELWHQPAFAQALRLYAGLLHNNTRQQFIHAVAQRNAYLAARCTTAYWQPEDAIKQLVVERAKLFAVFFDTCWEWCAQGFAALMELEAYEAVEEVLQQIHKTNSHRVTFKYNWKEFNFHFAKLCSATKLLMFLCNAAESIPKNYMFELIKSLPLPNYNFEKKHCQELEKLAHTLFQINYFREVLFLEGKMSLNSFLDTDTVIDLLKKEIVIDTFYYDDKTVFHEKLYYFLDEDIMSFCGLIYKHQLISYFKNKYLLIYMSILTETPAFHNEAIEFLLTKFKDTKQDVELDIMPLFIDITLYNSIEDFYTLPYDLLTQEQLNLVYELYWEIIPEIAIYLDVTLRHKKDFAQSKDIVRRYLHLNCFEDELLELMIIFEFELENEFNVDELISNLYQISISEISKHSLTKPEIVLYQIPRLEKGFERLYSYLKKKLPQIKTIDVISDRYAYETIERLDTYEANKDFFELKQDTHNNWSYRSLYSKSRPILDLFSENSLSLNDVIND